MKAILCVDDEEFVLKALAQDLKKHFSNEFSIELAQSTDDAFDILDEFKEDNVELLVIISDWLMPGLNGDEFLIQVHKEFPKIIKILLTGQADLKAIENAKNNTNLKNVFDKPWDSIELVSAIKHEMEKINE